jgi:hypothetical protein
VLFDEEDVRVRLQQVIAHDERCANHDRLGIFTQAHEHRALHLDRRRTVRRRWLDAGQVGGERDDILPR